MAASDDARRRRLSAFGAAVLVGLVCGLGVGVSLDAILPGAIGGLAFGAMLSVLFVSYVEEPSESQA
ncbi:MAG: hypothetical protein ABEJ35_05250 [Halobacteriaceae archaeon]